MAERKVTPRAQLIAYGTAIVLVVGGCFGALYLRGRDDPPAAASRHPTTPSGPVTTVRYSDALAVADSAIGTDFRRLDTSDAQTLASAIPITAQAMYAQVQTLRGIEPPARVAALHRDLITQLSGFSDLIQRLGTDQQQTPCPAAADSQYGSLLVSRFAAGLRADAKALLRADPAFVFGNFLPPAPGVAESRPRTGAYVKAPARRGTGHLKITNGGADAAVSLVPVSGTAAPLFTVFVRADSSFTVNGVGTGTYDVYYASGRGWNADRKGFTNGCSFSRFNRDFVFHAAPVIDTWSVTVTASAAGNVDPDDYPVS
jgi:hypothetical protein